MTRNEKQQICEWGLSNSRLKILSSVSSKTHLGSTEARRTHLQEE